MYNVYCVNYCIYYIDDRTTSHDKNKLLTILNSILSTEECIKYEYIMLCL